MIYVFVNRIPPYGQDWAASETLQNTSLGYYLGGTTWHGSMTLLRQQEKIFNISRYDTQKYGICKWEVHCDICPPSYCCCLVEQAETHVSCSTVADSEKTYDVQNSKAWAVAPAVVSDIQTSLWPTWLTGYREGFANTEWILYQTKWVRLCDGQSDFSNTYNGHNLDFIQASVTHQHIKQPQR